MLRSVCETLPFVGTLLPPPSLMGRGQSERILDTCRTRAPEAARGNPADEDCRTNSRALAGDTVRHRQGQTQKQICEWLNEEGVRVTGNALRVYLSRIRRQRPEDGACPSFVRPNEDLRTIPDSPTPGPTHKPHDPLVKDRKST